MPEQDVVVKSSWETYKRLLQYTKRYWKAFAVGVLGFLINAQAEWIFADLFKYVIDAIQNSDQSKKDLFPLAIIASFALRGLGTFMGSFGFAYVARNVVYALRRELFGHILNLPVEFYHTNAPGYVISKVTYVVDQVTGAATEALKVLVREGLVVVCLLGYLFYLNWRLSFLFFGVAPFIAFIVSNATKRFQKQSKRVQNTMGDVSHITSEAVNAYLTVKTFGGEKFEHDRFDQASHRNLSQGLKMVKTSSINTPIVQLLVAAGMSAVVWVALRPGIAGNITPGEFIAFLVAAGMLVKPVRQLTDVNAALQKGIAAADSLFILLDSPTEKNTGTFAPERINGKIEFRNVGFSYGEENGKVLQGINFTIQPGQTVALVGRSGSGKSTLANLIPRF
ncbi:MAG TPA: ABC transporter transmembrane domain-containing protein, partial [Pseudomonadales bacterium]|nr:ABC transporter transmembrane domain-containing protein [Pseudomonadales bacterium]